MATPEHSNKRRVQPDTTRGYHGNHTSSVTDPRKRVEEINTNVRHDQIYCEKSSFHDRRRVVTPPGWGQRSHVPCVQLRGVSHMTHLLTVSHSTFPEPLYGSGTWSDRTVRWTHEVSRFLEQTCVALALDQNQATWTTWSSSSFRSNSSCRVSSLDSSPLGPGLAQRSCSSRQGTHWF